VHASGVLAVVVCGLIVGHDSPRSESGASRLQTRAVWRLVNFLLEGLVFLLIGQQLPTIVDGLNGYSPSTIIVAITITVTLVLLIRRCGCCSPSPYRDPCTPGLATLPTPPPSMTPMGRGAVAGGIATRSDLTAVRFSR
jgi:NhaP-type Na+/H+ or K+/H+ antiporter